MEFGIHSISIGRLWSRRRRRPLGLVVLGQVRGTTSLDAVQLDECQACTGCHHRQGRDNLHRPHVVQTQQRCATRTSGGCCRSTGLCMSNQARQTKDMSAFGDASGQERIEANGTPLVDLSTFASSTYGRPEDDRSDRRPRDGRIDSRQRVLSLEAPDHGKGMIRRREEWKRVCRHRRLNWGAAGRRSPIVAWLSGASSG